jgi:hypothetical protein
MSRGGGGSRQWAGWRGGEKAESDDGGVVEEEAKWWRASTDRGTREDKSSAHVGWRLSGLSCGNDSMVGSAVTTKVARSKGARRGRGLKLVPTIALGQAQICLNVFPRIQKPLQISNSYRMPSRVLKMFKLCMRLYLNMVNNIFHCPNIKFALDLML